MSLFRKRKRIKLNPYINASERHANFSDELLDRCPNCHKIMIYSQMNVEHTCPYCDYHLQFPAYERLNWLLDEGTFKELNANLMTDNPLQFPQYKEKIKGLRDKTGLKEAVVTGVGQLDDYLLAIGVMDNRFMMASMGTVVGEKLARLFEYATDHRLPVVLFIASGGARMQEGILSLMQMAKLSQVVNKHHQAGLFYMPFLTHPTTGGVTASFAMQGDIILAEPKATIGFAGRRVIQQTINTVLPLDFQTAERIMEHGFIDQIVPRSAQKSIIKTLLSIHSKAKVS